jgi:primosomal protein N''
MHKCNVTHIGRLCILFIWRKKLFSRHCQSVSQYEQEITKNATSMKRPKEKKNAHEFMSKTFEVKSL